MVLLIFNQINVLVVVIVSRAVHSMYQWMNPEDNRVYKCTLCVDRVTVGQEPACVKTLSNGSTVL